MREFDSALMVEILKLFAWTCIHTLYTHTHARTYACTHAHTHTHTQGERRASLGTQNVCIKTNCNVCALPFVVRVLVYLSSLVCTFSFFVHSLVPNAVSSPAFIQSLKPSLCWNMLTLKIKISWSLFLTISYSSRNTAAILSLCWWLCTLGLRRGLVAAVASNLAVGVTYFNLNGSVFAIVIRWMFQWSFFFHHVTFYWNLLHSGILILTFYKLKMFAVDWKQNISSANIVRHGEETSSFQYLCAASSNCQFDLDRIMAVSVFVYLHICKVPEQPLRVGRLTCLEDHYFLCMA